MQLVGQSFSIGPLIDVALFLGIVASLAGAVGPLAVALAAVGMAAFSLVVAFYASETGGAGAMGAPATVSRDGLSSFMPGDARLRRLIAGISLIPSDG